MYKLYLGGVLFPIAPEKIQTKIKNKNTTIDILSGGEISVRKDAGLTDYSFELLLPNNQYPFAIYENGYKAAKYYLDLIEQWKVEKKAIKLNLLRKNQANKKLSKTSVKVTVEGYTITDDAKEGTDIRVSLNLKQYRSYKTKVVMVETTDEDKDTKPLKKEPTRDNSDRPKKKTYTVVSGDCLWTIAKKQLGDELKWKDIYNTNAKTIEDTAKKYGRKSSSNGHWIYPGTVLILP